MDYTYRVNYYYYITLLTLRKFSGDAEDGGMGVPESGCMKN